MQKDNSLCVKVDAPIYCLSHSTHNKKGDFFFGGGGGSSKTGVPNLMERMALKQIESPKKLILELDNISSLSERLKDSVHSLDIHPNGETILYSEATKLTYLSLLDNSVQKTFDLSSDISKITFDSSGSQFAVGTHEGKVIIYNSETFESICELFQKETGKATGIKGICFHPNKKMIMTTSGQKKLNIWDISTLSLDFSLQHEMNFRSCQYLDKGKKIVTAMVSLGSHSGVIIWAEKLNEKGKVIGYQNIFSKEKLTKNTITSLAVSCDENLLGVGTSEGEIICIEAKTLKVISLHRPHQWIVSDLCFVIPSKEINKVVQDGKNGAIKGDNNNNKNKNNNNDKKGDNNNNSIAQQVIVSVSVDSTCSVSVPGFGAKSSSFDFILFFVFLLVLFLLFLLIKFLFF